jgi:hypothetical protein
MNFRSYLLGAFIMPVFIQANAQQEQWDTYMAQFGGKPGSVMVDMGLMSSAPDKLLPYLVVTGPHAQLCKNKTGIPDAKEIEEMEAILDLTGAILSGVTAKKLAGTLTYNCERVNYYYVKDTIAIRNALARMYNNHYNNWTYTLKIKQEPLWLSYRTFLYPDSAAAAWMSNNRAMVAMLQNGDDLDIARNIYHTLYFKTDSGRASLIDFAKKHRYSVTKVYDAPTVAFPYELTISRWGNVIMDSLMAMQSELQIAAKPLHGYYKGWDAPLPKK